MSEFRLWDRVVVDDGREGIIFGMDFGQYGGLPYCVGFPNGDFDTFEAGSLRLLAEAAWTYVT